MLITKVRATPVNCRVGIRICSNPGNPTALTKAAVLMVVPPDVMGDNVSMSRDGGVWDEMKRTLSWTIDELQPGEMVEIEAQFERLMASHNVSTTPKFPVLMRCEGGAVFSGIYVSTDYSDSRSTKVNMKMIETSRIIYRKV
jgi:hypothetical protein